MSKKFASSARRGLSSGFRQRCRRWASAGNNWRFRQKKRPAGTVGGGDFPPGRGAWRSCGVVGWTAETIHPESFFFKPESVYRDDFSALIPEESEPAAGFAGGRAAVDRLHHRANSGVGLEQPAANRESGFRVVSHRIDEGGIVSLFGFEKNELLRALVAEQIDHQFHPDHQFGIGQIPISRLATLPAFDRIAFADVDHLLGIGGGERHFARRGRNPARQEINRRSEVERIR